MLPGSEIHDILCEVRGGLPEKKEEERKNMTQRLYDEDAYCREFTAVVTACVPVKDHFRIALDRTAFYPEGGGQPGDTGKLTVESDDTTDGQETWARVFDTHEKEEEILHYTDSALPVGTRVRGEIDWDHRFDLMQNHSGEHIVSGLIHAAYGYNNVGFHMGSDMITIDLDGELTMEQLREIELKANGVVWSDIPTKIKLCSHEEAANRTYRSKKEIPGTVRLVSFGEADTCACCGTHVKRTGEIGLIRILSCIRFRSGVRVEMLCGKRAFLYDTQVMDQNRQIVAALSAKPLGTAAAVHHLKDQNQTTAYRLAGMEQKYFAAKAMTLKGEQNLLLMTDEMESDSVRRLTAALMEECSGICVVMAGNDESGYKYALGQADTDLRAFVKEMNAALNGKGGGRPYFAQGNCSSGKAQIADWFRSREEGWRIEEG